MGLSRSESDVVVAHSTQRAFRLEQLRSEWTFRLFPDALEGGGCWNAPRREVLWVPPGQGLNAERSMIESARRARTRMRRYIVANGCDRMITLTYAVACHDRDQFVADMRDFWLNLRSALGGASRPYLWVPEWHKTHGLHAHAAISEYIPFRLIEAVWHRGRVRIERMSGAPIGQARAAVAERARICARYLAKYISKAFDDERRVLGRHRYDCAQGYQPASILFSADTRDGALGQACEHMGARADQIWFTPEDASYSAMWAAWRAAA